MTFGILRARSSHRAKNYTAIFYINCHIIFNCGYVHTYLLHTMCYESSLKILTKINQAEYGRKQVEEFLNVVGIIFPIKHWNCADNQNDSGRLAESSFQ